MFGSVAYAQAANAAASPAGGSIMVPLALSFAIFYFLIIRPQSKRQKKHTGFLGNLKRGDSVLTSSGILGTVEGITDKFVTLEIAEGVRIKILKGQLAGLANLGQGEA